MYIFAAPDFIHQNTKIAVKNQSFGWAAGQMLSSGRKNNFQKLMKE